MGRRDPEPCLCGAPDCPRCFPTTWWHEEDEDAAYERRRQWEEDEARREDRGYDD